MPPARKTATKKVATRASETTTRVRARAASTSAATRREVEQSIARFEKRLDDANDALKVLGGHLGRGSTRSYKEVTTALAALRREASKTNKQALKDFDTLRAALTHKAPAASGTNSRTKASSTASKKTSSTASKKTSSTASKKTSSTASKKASSTASKRSTAKPSTTKRSTATRARKTS